MKWLVERLYAEQAFDYFLYPDATWQKKTRINPLRGFKDGPHGSAVKQNRLLDILLLHIASCCPFLSRSSILASTSLDEVWITFASYFGFDIPVQQEYCSSSYDILEAHDQSSSESNEECFKPNSQSLKCDCNTCQVTATMFDNDLSDEDELKVFSLILLCLIKKILAPQTVTLIFLSVQCSVMSPLSVNVTNIGQHMLVMSAMMVFVNTR